ncbi:imm11 family protein [Vitiosangium sp. GDMCC 1.1324]|uniref:imm11 family protein n=1 Tax=Vitiosangium sp. (strain GDMCC 1.1324) TaxID=2138576 RepID=UPI000D342A3B|nr:DUF1629 domain-containing protein [Vitiosangium sp. GDMCC 1.1324]PTL77721.1 hypothetical protein DAT35_43860 [Vitiosangium sp. GDMCC 1.1324]
MSNRYFELTDDVYIRGRWDLGTPTNPQGQEVDDWRFTEGTPLLIEEQLKVPIRAGDGRSLDFTEAGLKVPVVSDRVASILAELASKDVQLIPVEVEAHPERFYILVCTRVMKCIDDEKSGEVQYWKSEDGRPEMTGTYRAVYDMRIEPTRVGDAKVFRTWGWEGTLVVSEDIKRALERIGATGAKFIEVTGPAASTPEEREKRRRSYARREQTDAAREAFWRTLGTLDASAIIPMVVGGPWPGNRERWCVIRRPEGRTLLVTDGLSDYFAKREEPSVGFGLELALETDTVMKEVYKAWPCLLLQRVGDEVAEHEHVREKVTEGLFSMEVSGKKMPKALVTGEGRVGVLLGMESRTLPRHFAMPAGEVKLITVKALLPKELEYLLEHGPEGQAELARRFAASGEEHLSLARRKPVV